MQRRPHAIMVVLISTIALIVPSLATADTVYYLKGSPADQATKLVQTPGTATFDLNAPTGAAPVTQTGSWLAGTTTPGDSLSFYWSGPFSGTVSGVLDLKWYWSTPNAETIALGAAVDVSVFADPDYTSPNPQPQKLIGNLSQVRFPISATPSMVQTLIPVSGTVSQTLLIQVVPHFSDTGNGLHVYYNATSTPSSFSFHATPVRLPFPAATPASGLPPRFSLFTPSATQLASGLGVDAGEPSIGANWSSGAAFFQSFLTTFKVTFDDACSTTPASTWLNKSSVFTSQESFDPILYTDSATGRTFVSQLLLGTTTSASAFTDNDGELWLPTQGAGIASGIDHQTLGGGPFHAPIPTGAAYPNAVYYCAQDIAEAGCAISLDGGKTFGPAVPIYNVTQCGGLHGHVKVAPDGTAYVPNKDCGGQQGVIVSENNGITWDIRTVSNSQAAGSDPSVAIARGGRVYFGFMDNDHHPVVALSDDQGRNWYNASDVGAAAGVQNAVFAEMVAGDQNRAAFAFLGTKSPGGLQDRSFPGVWSMYVATTYDGGQTWSLTSSTPNDPVQRGPIWLAGGSEVSRNLLDFNDATIDRFGRVLIAYADGCVDSCIQSPDSARGNSYSAVASILRQTGGRRMFAQYDPSEPTAPSAPALTVTRNGSLATLTWSQANDGGKPATYSVYRWSNGAETLLANVGAATRYVDATANANTTYTYRVAAKSSVGNSCGSNAVTSAPNGSSCSASGVPMISDPAGDQVGAPLNPSLDILSLSVSEPYYADGSNKVVLTMKVASLATLPPRGIWRVLWAFPTNKPGQYYVEMHTDQNGVVGFEYGTIDVTKAVVTSVGQPHPLGTPDPETSYSPDGTIRFVLSTSKIGNAVAGDLLGNLLVRTFLETGSVVTSSRTAIDVAAAKTTYALVGNAFCAPPTINCLEDDDPRIAYTNGWHLVNDPNASAGHFRMSAGRGRASLTFTVPANKYGAITYFYAKSPKGGAADVYVDGVLRGTISYAGSTGTTKAPQYGFSERYAGLAGGSHTFEIRGRGIVYLDKLCLESSSSNSQPTSGPGTTTTGSFSPLAGQEIVSQLTVPADAQEISVIAEASTDQLVRIVLVDPTGLAVTTADTSSGIAVIEQPVTQGGIYLLKVTNLSLGPVDVWTAFTPLEPR